ncbi:MAG: amidohydrolase family protein, partial [Pseudomonadota bacterium]
MIDALTARLEEWDRWPSTLSPGLSPHSVYTLCPEALSAVGALAERKNLPLAVHAAETRISESSVVAGHAGGVKTGRHSRIPGTIDVPYAGNFPTVAAIY